MWDKVATLCINLSFILMAFAFFYLVVTIAFRLSVEANATIASLLVIGLSDLYLGYGRK
jgi:hypothetical protein